MPKTHKQNLHFRKDSPSSFFTREAYMILCVLISMFLVLLDITNSNRLNKVKMNLQNHFSTIFSYTEVLSKGIDGFFMNFNTISSLNKENQYLLKENANMQMWKNKAIRFEAENNSLKELLKFDERENYEYISSRIRIDNHSGFNKNIVIKANNLNKSQTIVSSHGLVGRVLETSNKHANVLLITDINSKIPALIERTRDKVIISGNNSNLLSLNYLPEESDIKIGDRVITSGDGNVFVPGVLIGRVSYINKDKIKLVPATDFGSLEFVSVLINKKED